MKKVYSIEKSTLGWVKEVDNNYRINPIFETEKEPIKNALILAWDSNTREWFDNGMKTESKIDELEIAIIELYQMNLELKNEIETMKGDVKND